MQPGRPVQEGFPLPGRRAGQKFGSEVSIPWIDIDIR
ncbi:hypothetical protein AvCA_46760 [Azotobacter vinelandii CA]|uniref:Uncharacterized protein n=2 Tax=Azotobacter vinelandii TaxID=354 RepID=C1DIW2_AZOVD|nr:hypothetical protein Avin_46760 [Azotobacter vinelandii DJ]AGK15884.1 hypothetical protein AvCA_46760 [Azotobacter vinelandii CA]AGK22154.1 hypothetical protein AvCA6_46760 [Azotobacter vinelandii CA6]